MLTDWWFWVRSLHTDEIISILGILLIADAPRYTFCSMILFLMEFVRDLGRLVSGEPEEDHYTHCPSVCAFLVGYNEGATIADALESIWGTYPDLEIVVVDDGSNDEMTAAATRFANAHDQVLVLHRPERGGKSSALNWALKYTEAEIVIGLDTDSHLGANAIWEIVQPFENPEVGAVSGTVKAWNPFVNLVTWLQSYEYRQTIFMGRMFLTKLRMLAIVSGAFGAFRRDLLMQLKGWDVGPGEDGDLSLRIRKAGYQIVTAQKALCQTNVPVAWGRLIKQRLRWDRTVVTFECRKHVDFAYFWSANFRWSDFLMLMDRWFFNIFCVFLYWAYWIWLFTFADVDPWDTLLLLYLCQMFLELIQVLALLYYSDSVKQDLGISLVMPFVPFYHALLRAVDAVAILDELLLRKSYEDNFVPERVRNATWHW